MIARVFNKIYRALSPQSGYFSAADIDEQEQEETNSTIVLLVQ